MKKFIFAAIAVASLAACTKPNAILPNRADGTWNMYTHFKTSWVVGGLVESHDTNYITFRKDGTGTVQNPGATSSTNITWFTNDDQSKISLVYPATLISGPDTNQYNVTEAKWKQETWNRTTSTALYSQDEIVTLTPKK